MTRFVVVAFVLFLAATGAASATGLMHAEGAGVTSGTGCITCHNPLDGNCVDPNYEMHSAWGLGPMQQPEHSYCAAGGCHAGCGMSQADERLLESIAVGDSRSLRHFIRDHPEAWVNAARGALQGYSKCRAGKVVALHIPLSQIQLAAVTGSNLGHTVGR